MNKTALYRLSKSSNADKLFDSDELSPTDSFLNDKLLTHMKKQAWVQDHFLYSLIASFLSE